MLLDLKTHSTLPWLIGGDINEIFYNLEKRGGPAKPQSVLDRFQEALEDCELFNLGYKGEDFTWWNGRDGAQSAEERLDRFCATTELPTLFPEAIVYHVDEDLSDHLPILLRTSPTGGTRKKVLQNVLS